MFDDGFASSHDLGIARHPHGYPLLHFFRSQPGDGPILFIARTLGFEQATLAAAHPIVVNGAPFLVGGKAVDQLLTRRTDVTVLPGIILKALLSLETARGIRAGKGFVDINGDSNTVSGPH